MTSEKNIITKENYVWGYFLGEKEIITKDYETFKVLEFEDIDSGSRGRKIILKKCFELGFYDWDNYIKEPVLIDLIGQNYNDLTKKMEYIFSVQVGDEYIDISNNITSKKQNKNESILINVAKIRKDIKNTKDVGKRIDKSILLQGIFLGERDVITKNYGSFKVLEFKDSKGQKISLKKYFDLTYFDWDGYIGKNVLVKLLKQDYNDLKDRLEYMFSVWVEGEYISIPSR